MKLRRLSFILGILFVPLAVSQSCDKNANCTVTAKGFSCTCNHGYEGSTTGCVNIDECSSQFPCDAPLTCVDTDGSYECYCGGVICHPDLAKCVNGTNVTSSCVCLLGYFGNGTSCEDVNECENGENMCHLDSKCTNTLGSYYCTCNDGYTGNGTSCSDVDECATGTFHCEKSYQCDNTKGSYECKCGETTKCDKNAKCSQTKYGSSCLCNAGFSGSGVTCDDIDECSQKTSNCSVHAICENSIGSYRCECKESYMGTGFQCSGARKKLPRLLYLSLLAILSSIFIY